MLRFNTEVLDAMGFDVQIDGSLITIYGRNLRELHLTSVTELLYDSGCSESEVEGICGDITDLVNQRLIFKAMIRSGNPTDVVNPKKKGKNWE